MDPTTKFLFSIILFLYSNLLYLYTLIYSLFFMLLGFALMYSEVTRGPGWTFVTSVTRERWSSTPLRTLWSNAI